MLEWVMRKKGIPGVLVRSMKSLYDIVKTRVTVDFEVKVEMQQGSVLLPFFVQCW